MADIGATLREARMRARIDISEVEAETKIRAKYLRALENEEWDLLPGSTYVKSFLRTYAEVLDLDAKLLVDEFRMRHENLSDVELQPISAAAPGRERRRPQARQVPRWAVLVVIVVGLLVALGLLSGGDSTPPVTGQTQTTATKTSTTKSKPAAKKPPPAPKRVKLRIVATGPVNVCLKAGDRTLVNSVTLQAGEKTDPYRSRRFRLTLGNNNARLVINGHARDVPAEANGIGLEITPQDGRQPLSETERPACNP